MAGPGEQPGEEEHKASSARDLRQELCPCELGVHPVLARGCAQTARRFLSSVRVRFSGKLCHVGTIPR